MTAIAGCWAYETEADPAADCALMLAALRAYGPEDPSLHRSGRLAMGRGLYRLLPEDRFDRQPLVGGGGRLRLVADIRLDNREEIGASLHLEPSALRALADSALLLRAIERWGEGALDRIAGDFAFALFDSDARRLTLARDPLGQRPLFWRRGRGSVDFASMPKGLTALDRNQSAPDRDTVARYLALIPPRPGRSFLEGIERVPPGHVVTLTAETTSSRRWWSPERSELRLRRLEDYVEAYREQLDTAVRSRLRRHEGDVGAHLSGGWDSSSVTATAAKLLGPEGGRLFAFTAIPASRSRALAPPNRFADESGHANETARLYPNIDHVLVESSGRSPFADLDLHFELFGRPLFNLCNHVWLSDIRSAARERGVTVMLTGEIGNWTISAAPNSILADYLRRGRIWSWGREALAMLVQRRARLRGVAANSFGPWLPESLWRRASGLSAAAPAQARSALHPALREPLAAEAPALRLGAERPPADHFLASRAAFYEMDFGEYRKGVLGGWGIDKRDATADRRLVEFCLSLPPDMLMKDGVRRPLARAALQDRLPAAVLDERRKGYQGSDWHRGLTDDLARIQRLVDAIAADPLASSIVDAEMLRALVRDWPSGGWEEPHVIARYRGALLDGVQAGHFLLAASSASR